MNAFLLSAFFLLLTWSIPAAGSAMPSSEDAQATLLYERCLRAAASLTGEQRAAEEKHCRQTLARARSFTAQELWEAFNNDTIAAEERWHDRIVSVSGIVTSIGKSPIGGYPEVRMGLDGFGTRGLRCRFPATAQALLATIQPGQHLALLGVCKGFSYNDLLLIDSCEVLEERPENPPRQAAPMTTTSSPRKVR